MTPFEKELG